MGLRACPYPTAKRGECFPVISGMVVVFLAELGLGKGNKVARFFQGNKFCRPRVKGYRPKTNKVVKVQYGHQIDRPTRSVGLGPLL
jgi:hypothetical protein